MAQSKTWFCGESPQVACRAFQPLSLYRSLLFLVFVTFCNLTLDCFFRIKYRCLIIYGTVECRISVENALLSDFTSIELLFFMQELSKQSEPDTSFVKYQVHIEFLGFRNYSTLEIKVFLRT